MEKSNQRSDVTDHPKRFQLEQTLKEHYMYFDMIVIFLSLLNQLPSPPPGVKYPLDGDHLLLVNGAVRSVIFFVYSLRSLCGMTLHLAFHNESILCLNVILTCHCFISESMHVKFYLSKITSYSPYPLLSQMPLSM